MSSGRGHERRPAGPVHAGARVEARRTPSARAKASVAPTGTSRPGAAQHARERDREPLGFGPDAQALRRHRGAHELAEPVRAHALLVLAVLQDRAERRVDRLLVEPRRAERRERLRPVDRLRDTGRLVELEVAQRLDRGRDVARERVGNLRRAQPDDRELALEVGMRDPVVEAAALQRVVHVARAVRREHDDRRHLGAHDAELGHRDRPVGEDLEQERLELVVGAVDLVDQQHRRDRAVVRRARAAAAASRGSARSTARLRRPRRRSPRPRAGAAAGASSPTRRRPGSRRCPRSTAGARARRRSSGRAPSRPRSCRRRPRLRAAAAAAAAARGRSTSRAPRRRGSRASASPASTSATLSGTASSHTPGTQRPTQGDTTSAPIRRPDRYGSGVAMTHDLVIRGGTIVDGTGAHAVTRRRRDRRRPHHRGRHGRRDDGRRDDRRRRRVRHARLRRHPHPPRRAARVGPRRDLVVLARRHVGRARQLRRDVRARARRPGALARRADGVGRGHPGREHPRRLAWDWETYGEYLAAIDACPRASTSAA